MAREVMLPQVFRGFRTERVLAHAQIADQLGMVLGPLLAALALEWWSWEVVLGATAVLFMVADVAMKVWRSASPVHIAEPASLHHLKCVHWLQPLGRYVVWESSPTVAYFWEGWRPRTAEGHWAMPSAF